MKHFIIPLLVVILRIIFAYGVCLLFVCNLNILAWSLGAKFIFLIITLILLSVD